MLTEKGKQVLAAQIERLKVMTRNGVDLMQRLDGGETQEI
jgi:hypothetical protein